MQLECVCGTALSDTGYPNDIEHLLIGTHAIERLQEVVDKEVEKEGRIDLWPEHWDESGAIEVWKCFKCGRLYMNIKQPPERIVVYSIERIGLK
jgi:hypothetical protein